MNLLKKSEGVEIYFYDEDDLKDATSLRNSLEEFLEYFQDSKIYLRFMEISSLRIESLSLLLSFTKELNNKGNNCIWVCSSSLHEQLVQLGIKNFISLQQES